MKRIYAVIVSVVLVCMGCFFACTPKVSGDLKISFYYGGYGESWGRKLAEKFTEETGIAVEVDPNPQLQSEVPSMLENGTDSDLIFCHNIKWEVPAARGLIEPLNDLYSSQIEDDGVLFSDRVLQSLLAECRIGETYYKVPWTNGAGGFVYNAKMFEDNKWEVPETYDELMALCKTIYEAKVKVDPDDPRSATVVPFAWSSSTYYWDYVVFDWWAQLAGIENINRYKMIADKTVFDPEGDFKPFVEAVEAWKDLVAEHPEYSIENSSGTLYTAAQMNFVNGYAAMMPCAQWIESEMRDYIDPEVCVMALMPTPFLKNAKKDADGNYIRVNFQVGGGDSIIIPACSDNKEAAKEFLRFLARDENCKIFTEQTFGVMLGFNYDNLDGIRNKTQFMDDVFEINKNSVKFNTYSQHALVLSGKISLQWPAGGAQMYSELYDDSSISVPQAFADRYDQIVDSWDVWMSEAGVE